MPLRYNYTKCNLKNVSPQIIECVINLTMLIEVGKFTEQNIDDVFDRILILEAFDGPFLWDDDNKSILNNKSLIKQFIGLSTNVTNLSIKKWFSKRLTLRRREQEHLKKSMVALGDKVA